MTGLRDWEQFLARQAADRKRFLRFLLAGVVNTGFGFAVYAVAILADAPVWVALLTANCAGIVFNFFTTAGYVFDKLLLNRFPRFVLAYLVVYGFNLGLIEMLLQWIDRKILAQALLTLPMALVSYMLMNRFAFAPDPSARAAEPHQPQHRRQAAAGPDQGPTA